MMATNPINLVEQTDYNYLHMHINMHNTEWEKAVNNLKKLNDNVNQIISYVDLVQNNNQMDKVTYLSVYDKAITNLLKNTELIRKFNVQCKITLLENNNNLNMNDIQNNYCNKPPTNNNVLKFNGIETMPEYPIDFEGSCIITYINNAKDCQFYMMDTNSKTYTSGILNMQTYAQYKPFTLQRIPAPGDIFGIFLDEQYMFRAVIETTSQCINNKIGILLIDLGEMVYISSDTAKLYELSDAHKRIPGLALRCKLIKANGKTDPHELCCYLKANLYVPQKFKVVKCTSECMDVELLSTIRIETNPFHDSNDSLLNLELQNVHQLVYMRYPVSPLIKKADYPNVVHPFKLYQCNISNDPNVYFQKAVSWSEQDNGPININNNNNNNNTNNCIDNSYVPNITIDEIIRHSFRHSTSINPSISHPINNINNNNINHSNSSSRSNSSSSNNSRNTNYNNGNRPSNNNNNYALEYDQRKSTNTLNPFAKEFSIKISSSSPIQNYELPSNQLQMGYNNPIESNPNNIIDIQNNSNIINNNNNNNRFNNIMNSENNTSWIPPIVENSTLNNNYFNQQNCAINGDNYIGLLKPMTTTMTAPITTTTSMIDSNNNNNNTMTMMPFVRDVTTIDNNNNSNNNNDNDGVTKDTMTREQLKQLFDESKCTTNAMKAVMGYAPKDDKRICPFYNPKTQSCFKINCKMEHVEKLEDGWTRDRVPVKAISIKHQLAVPETGTIISIIPTHVVTVELIYAHIPTLNTESRYSLKELVLKLNSIENESNLIPFKRIPEDFELVIARYTQDKMWYRAKILTVIDEYTVQVFFVDYGNCDILHIETDICYWDERFDYLPFQAVICQIDNIVKKCDNDYEAIAALKTLILNKPYNADIINNYDQLYVRLVDEDGYDIGEILCAMNHAKPKPVTKTISKNQILPG